jgi:hypothetical protein
MTFRLRLETGKEISRRKGINLININSRISSWEKFV